MSIFTKATAHAEHWRTEAAVRDELVRAVHHQCRGRSRLPLVCGYAWCWSTPTDIRDLGSMRFTVERGCLDVEPDAYISVSHTGRRIAELADGNARFLLDSFGAFVAFQPNARDVVDDMKAGKLQGMSPGFLPLRPSLRPRFKDVWHAKSATLQEASLTSTPGNRGTAARLLDGSRMSAADAIEHDEELARLEAEHWLMPSRLIYTPEWCDVLYDIVNARAVCRLEAI